MFRRKDAMEIHQLLKHIRETTSDRRVHRDTGVARPTVKKFRAWAKERGLLEGPLPPVEALHVMLNATMPFIIPPQNQSTLEPYRDIILELAGQGVPMTAIRQQIRQRGGDGSYWAVRRFIMALGQEMPVSAVANLIGEHDTRVWRALRHYVAQAVKARRLEDVTTVGVDETASRRGHRYVTLFFDLDKKRLVYATTGKDASTISRFVEHLKGQGGTPQQVRRVACDMSGAFIKGIQGQLPNAEITFDRFHLTKIVNEAVDQVRREEVATNEILKKTRFMWLTNPKNLTRAQKR